MRVLIIGSVAGGTSAAAKMRRNSEDLEIVIYDMDKDISYSGCGIPYFVGEDYISREDLTPRNSQWFKKRFNIDIFTEHKVTDIDFEKKLISVINLKTGEAFTDSYDKLVIAVGANPSIPNIEGIDSANVFPVRNVQSGERIKIFIKEKNPKSAVIIGAGFIGLEMAENLKSRGLDVTLIESAPHVMPSMDYEMALYIQDHLLKNGVKLYTSEKVESITENGRYVNTLSGSKIATDMIVVATGVKPATDIVKNKGIKLGLHGGIIVNDKMETNIPDVYAVGDCCEVKSTVTGEYIYRPLGSTANKMGRIAGDVITGGNLRFRGVPGTGIFKTFELTVAQTGLSEKEAATRGIDYVVSHNIKENQSKYLKESRELVIKCISERKSERILGVQIVGERGVDKRIDVFVTAMTFGAKVSDLFHLDLAYAPPFSTTKDPVMYSGMILDNAINRGRQLITPHELMKNRDSFTVIDVRSKDDYNKGHIDGAINIPHEELKETAKSFDKNKKYVVHCNKGTTGNAAQNLLLNLGFKEVYNLSGGYSQYKIEFGRVAKD
ncbi:MAG: Coenzyme A disulfide reductase [Spirochaetes bacterium ADurb.Bin218]|jgi:NADPH-dependent 2,4-dienoyl-CoA reductase/sulfur reductase-like enzyme/rhodanese-related sulfurtransferase|nr:MAG: Coenzyme A disulfide reductase [Spirochaetes bacterium ADurb.Bin218]HPX91278.1 FAD-dependent oxidoreductase [Spirochaetota bacterium]